MSPPSTVTGVLDPSADSRWTLRIDYHDGYYEEGGLTWAGVLAMMNGDAHQGDAEAYSIRRVCT